jgi:hypothetical protein
LVSNRKRANDSITNKINQLSSRNSKLSKRTQNPNLSRTAVSGNNVRSGTLGEAPLAPTAVDDQSVNRGAVGSANLGVVNELSSDSALVVNVPGTLQLDGESYPSVPDNIFRPISQGAGGAIVQTGALRRATIDPLWTYGLPNVILSDSGAVVPTNGWSSGMSTPKPGQLVEVAWNGTGWFVVHGIVSGPGGLLQSVRLDTLMEPGWDIYDPVWRTPSVTRTPDGIVLVGGMLRAVTAKTVDTLILVLPVKFRPDSGGYLTFTAQGGANVLQRLQVRPNGEVWWLAGAGGSLGAGSYLSLGGLTYPAAGVATWSGIATSGITTTGAQFATGWSAVVGTEPAPGYWIDPYGLVWWRGAAKKSTSVSVDNDPMILYNSQPLRPTLETHYPSHQSNGLTAGIGSSFASNALRFKFTNTLAAGASHNLTGVVVASVASDTALSWNSVSFTNSWGNHTPASFPSGSYANRNGLTFYRGLIAGGTIGASAFTMPVGFRPMGGDANPTSGAYSSIYARLSSGGACRLDTAATGTMTISTGSNGWYSIDGLMTPREQ